MSKKEDTKYLLIWGDTVKFKDLISSLIIGMVFGSVSAQGGLWYLKTYHADMSRGALMGTALLIGALSCILAGAINAKLFAPKRVLIEGNSASDTLDAKLFIDLGLEPELEAEYLKETPPDVIEEMKQLALYDFFATGGGTLNPSAATTSKSESAESKE